LQFGGVVSASGQNFTTLNEQLKWSKKDHYQNIMIISFMCIFGMATGCLAAGKLFRFGKRRVIMIFQIVSMIGSILSLVSLNFVTILIGRFIFGFSAGIFVNMCPVIIEETVPGRLMDHGYGSSTNISINAMVMINMSLGLLVTTK
jgi:MFS family permease